MLCKAIVVETNYVDHSHALDVLKPKSHAQDIGMRQMLYFDVPFQVIDGRRCKYDPVSQLKPRFGHQKPYYNSSKMYKSSNVPCQHSSAIIQRLQQIGHCLVVIWMAYSPYLWTPSPRASCFGLPPSLH
jgi:hypothetical protein